MALTSKTGRLPVKCITCQAVMCYVSEPALNEGKRRAGFGMIPPTSALSALVTSGAIRCVTCEARAVTLESLNHAQSR